MSLRAVLLVCYAHGCQRYHRGGVGIMSEHGGSNQSGVVFDRVFEEHVGGKIAHAELDTVRGRAASTLWSADAPHAWG